jgi:hypothetical protein
VWGTDSIIGSGTKDRTRLGNPMVFFRKLSKPLEMLLMPLILLSAPLPF